MGQISLPPDVLLGVVEEEREIVVPGQESLEIVMIVCNSPGHDGLSSVSTRNVLQAGPEGRVSLTLLSFHLRETVGQLGPRKLPSGGGVVEMMIPQGRAELGVILGNTQVQGATGVRDSRYPGQRRVTSGANLTNRSNSTQYFLLEVIDEKFVDVRDARIEPPVRPGRRLPEEESLRVDFPDCGIDFLIHRSKVFPPDLSRKDQTTVLVYISCPGLIENVVPDNIIKISHLRRDDSPDLCQLVHGPELVVVEVLIDVTGLVGDVTTEPVLYPSQRPGERSLGANPDIDHFTLHTSLLIPT